MDLHIHTHTLTVPHGPTYSMTKTNVTRQRPTESMNNGWYPGQAGNRLFFSTSLYVLTILYCALHSPYPLVQLCPPVGCSRMGASFLVSMHHFPSFFLCSYRGEQTASKFSTAKMQVSKTCFRGLGSISSLPVLPLSLHLTIRIHPAGQIK